MPKIKKAVDVATFHMSVRSEGTGRLRILNVQKRHRTRVSTELRECDDGVERRRFRDMQHWGVDYYFAPLPAQGKAVRIVWAEYQDDDGRWVATIPDVDIGDQFSELRRGMELLQKIGEVIERRIGHMNRKPTDSSFSDPDVVLDALRHSTMFVEVERFEVEHRGYWLEPLHPFYQAVAG
jgi:hypothetical protein